MSKKGFTKKKKIVLIIVAILTVAFIVVNILDINRFVVRKNLIKTKKLAKNKEVRFVLIADLHSATFGKNNAKLLSSIRKCNPDFIVVAGDMMTAKPGKDNQPAVDFMNALTKEYKVYYGLGNHEHRARLYKETYGDMYDEYFEAIKSDNLTVLDNESVALDDVEIIGLTIDREYYKRLVRKKMSDTYLTDTLGTPDEDKFSILIAHNPEYGDQYFDYPADLFVSGHLHGGIIRLPWLGGVASPSIHLFPKYDGGLYQKNGRYGYVSCGLGTHTVPMRFNNPGEITLFTIQGE
jgi:hypothetical protein